MIITNNKKKKTLLRFIIITVFMTITIICTAQFGGGQGTENDPWQISRPEHLNEIRNHMNDYFIQTQDLDFNIAPWNEGLGWDPIGESFTVRFTGHYNGNGYIIDGLYINRPNETNVGLFGHTGGNGRIINVSLTNVNITGSNYVGSLVGWNRDRCQAINCYSTGSVTGASHVGGMFGYNQNGGSNLVNSYSRVNVTGGNQAGGLIGHNRNGAGIIKSYSTGRVTGAAEVGGLVGFNQEDSPVTNSYWDVETSGRELSAAGEGKMTRQMVYPYDDPMTVYQDWDFEDMWVHDENRANEGYPALYFQELEPPIVVDTPQVEVDVVTIENVKNIRIRWEPVEDALSYKIYTSENPYSNNWGDPVAIVGEDVTTYTRPLTEAERKFFYVVASIEEVP